MTRWLSIDNEARKWPHHDMIGWRIAAAHLNPLYQSSWVQDHRTMEGAVEVLVGWARAFVALNVLDLDQTLNKEFRAPCRTGS